MQHLSPALMPAPPAEEIGGGELLAAAAPAISDVAATWNGAVIYCQPGCIPCERLIADIRRALALYRRACAIEIATLAIAFVVAFPV